MHISSKLITEMECPTKALSFKVNRKNPELITPAQPTPHEFKPLSDIDDQDMMRVLPPIIGIYEGIPSPSMQGKDPADVLRDAIARALVFYYPFAGRLREIATRKLVVECTAEGVLFIEADADATVQQFADILHPPFLNLDQLLYNVPGSDGITDCPLLLIQVTRFKCGGFTVGLRFNHTMCDGVGFLKLLFAIAELARGSEAPSIRPVWERHLLSARNPPCVPFAHPEYEPPNPRQTYTLENTVERSFFFSWADISALRGNLPPHLRTCSQFDILSACVWRCRTLALSPNPNQEEYRLIFFVSMQNKLNPLLPMGYYGNAIVGAMAVATAEELRSNPLDFTIELVRKAKSRVTEEFVRSVADLLVMRGRPCFALDNAFMVSDVSRICMDEVDFGWGKAAYCGMAKGGIDSMAGVLSWFLRSKNNKGENGMIVPISLPPHAMELFIKELNLMMEVARKTSTISQAEPILQH